MGIDLGDKWPISESVLGVIIATPTCTHYEMVKTAKSLYNCPILVEKPISMHLKECKELALYDDVFCVNNWAFALPGQYLQVGKNTIDYNYYYTGPHGELWDCCQLAYLCKRRKLTINLTSPFWTCYINDIKITLEDIHHSYIMMLHAFLSADYERLWTAKDGYKMSQLIHRSL